MEIHTSDTPAKKAGEYISEAIKEHDGDVLCLLSGGSALDVVEYISSIKDLYHKNDDFECRTIFMMGDERVSGEPTINNYLQLKTRYPEHPILRRTIPTVPEIGEDAHSFATRVTNEFAKMISTLEKPKIIALLGLGTDGHTAGIFPLSKESFQETYQDDSVYVPVHVAGLTIDSRASFTPSFMLEVVDVIVGYVVGASKKTMLESLLKESKELWERPAEILKRHPNNVHLYTDISI